MQLRINFILALSLLVISGLITALLTIQPTVRGQTPSEAASPAAISLQLEKFTEGFADPVEIAHAGDSRLFVIERQGIIHIVQSNGVKLTTPFLSITNRVGSTESEQGLLGMAFESSDPQTFYVNYTNKQGDTVIARYKVLTSDANRADVNSEQIVLTVDQPAANHNAGDLAFGPDGELYIPLGDGGGGGDPNGNGQNLNALLGKTLRIHVTGETTYSIPAGNPFANDNNPNTRAEIWSYGWRNPWRFSFDRLTGDMYLGDVGQGRREEVDFEPEGVSGRNYGWNKCEGAIVYPPSATPTPCPTNAGYTQPLFDYGRSDGTTVTGGYVYRGTQYPNLVGHYLFADFGSGNFWTILPDGQGGGVATKHGTLGVGNPSTFGEDVNGELYVADYGTGIIYRIKDTAPVMTGTPTSTQTATPIGTATPTSTGTVTATPTFVPTTATLVPTAPPPEGTPRAYMPQIRRGQ